MHSIFLSLFPSRKETSTVVKIAFPFCEISRQKTFLWHTAPVASARHTHVCLLALQGPDREIRDGLLVEQILRKSNNTLTQRTLLTTFFVAPLGISFIFIVYFSKFFSYENALMWKHAHTPWLLRKKFMEWHTCALNILTIKTKYNNKSKRIYWGIRNHRWSSIE